jgi:hypothetical protein
MAGKTLKRWMRDNSGYVCLTPVDSVAAGVTDHGDIALFLGGQIPSVSGSEQHCGQYLCSTSDAMTIAKMLVRAVALSDAQASAPKVAGLETNVAPGEGFRPSDARRRWTVIDGRHA